MRRPVPYLLLFVALALSGACSNESDTASPPDDAGPADTSSTTASTTTNAASTTTLAGVTSTTAAPPPECPADEILAVVDSAIQAARLRDGDGWSTDPSDSRFDERTTSGAEFANRLGLDCGLTATQAVGDQERFMIAAWTGPRMAWVVQTTEAPSMPYEREATFTVSIGSTEGEFLDGDERALWAGTLDGGETFIIGHVDYVLGAAAKDWVAGPREPFDEEISLDAERHAVAALKETGMRKIGIAEPAQLGSEEGHVSFVSQAGQILVADVAPTDWFDPMISRYFTGSSRLEVIAGIEVRVTDPAEGDNLGFTRGAEYGWACDDFVWLFQPPLNGDADEMIASVEAVIETRECIAG